MKNIAVIAGFILCAFAGIALMNLSTSIKVKTGAWAQDGEHMQAINAASQSMIDKCKLDRLQGRLKNHEESANCSNPTIKEAFIKQGFTNTEKLDEYLAHRRDYARMYDNAEVTEDQKRNLTEEALVNLLEFAPEEPAKK